MANHLSIRASDNQATIILYPTHKPTNGSADVTFGQTLGNLGLYVLTHRGSHSSRHNQSVKGSQNARGQFKPHSSSEMEFCLEKNYKS